MFLETVLPYMVTPRRAAKAGSAALTICAKLTAPRFIEKMLERCAPAAQPATGTMAMRSSRVMLGGERASGAIQR